MILEPQKITLKDGRVCVLRTPRTEDGAALLDYMLRCGGETEYVLSYPDEFSLTAEQEGAFAEAQAQSPDSLMITCFDGGRAVGNAQISFEHRDKLRHRATVGVGILRAYWRQGIATRLMELLIPQYLIGIIYSALVQSFASEQCARMNAMDAATRNANEMMDQLGHELNRARQSQITNEIAEIIAGADALEG